MNQHVWGRYRDTHVGHGHNKVVTKFSCTVIVSENTKTTKYVWVEGGGGVIVKHMEFMARGDHNKVMNKYLTLS